MLHKGGNVMRENKTLEFKETVDSSTFLKTVSAFANYGSGRILFGVSDDGIVKGIINANEDCLRIENKINDNISPTPTYTLNINKENVITLEVFEGVFKPYLFKGIAYKRSDSSTLEVERVELNRLILEGQNLSFEDTPSSVQELTFKILEKELIKEVKINTINNDILRTLGLFTRDGKFNNAASLLADNNIFKGVDIIRFGDNIDEIMDRETYENISILSMLNKTVAVYKKYYQYEKIEGTSRKKREKVPEKAFRESLANALIHRLWDVNAYVRIGMYNDRIEIISPGGLPAGISEKEYLDGQISLLRNPTIANVFFRLNYIEKFGTGIQRINNAYEGLLVTPKYKVYDNSITIILPVITNDAVLTLEEEMIIKVLKNNLKLSRVQIEKEVHFNKDKTLRVINTLVEKNIIKKTGVSRGVKYSLIK